jgi:hypothetical protein
VRDLRYNSGAPGTAHNFIFAEDSYMSRSRRSPLLLLLCLLLPAVPASAQTSAPPSDTTALKQSLDQIVSLLHQLLQESSRRDTAAVLMGRIDLAERRLVPKEQELRTLHDRKAAADKEALDALNGMNSLKEMQKQDTTGSAAQAFDQERVRLSGMAAAAQAKAADLAQQAAFLEGEIATRRQAIDGMEAQLDALLTIKR